MVNQNQVQDSLLNSLAQKIYDENLYLQVDTSTVMPSEVAVELTNGGTQVGVNAALFNKERDTGTLITAIDDNVLIMQFTLSSGEPYSQPVNLGSFGLCDQQTSGGGLNLATALPTTFTKDTNLQAKIRSEIKVIRVDEV